MGILLEYMKLLRLNWIRQVSQTVYGIQQFTGTVTWIKCNRIVTGILQCTGTLTGIEQGTGTLSGIMIL